MAEQPNRPKNTSVSVVSGDQSPFNYYYGTFQGVANYQPPPPPPPTQPVIGFPQPVPPAFLAPHQYSYHNGYQTVPGYATLELRPFREERLPCCGVGLGWSLFITGWFLGALPWYIGAFLLLCVRLDHREKPGLIACALAAVLVSFAITLGLTGANYSW